MEQDHLDEIIEKNPNVDPTAIERSEQVVKQLKDVGIEIGGYRLEPALGGATAMRSSNSNKQDAKPPPVV